MKKKKISIVIGAALALGIVASSVIYLNPSALSNTSSKIFKGSKQGILFPGTPSSRQRSDINKGVTLPIQNPNAKDTTPAPRPVQEQGVTLPMQNPNNKDNTPAPRPVQDKSDNGFMSFFIL